MLHGFEQDVKPFVADMPAEGKNHELALCTKSQGMGHVSQNTFVNSWAVVQPVGDDVPFGQWVVGRNLRAAGKVCCRGHDDGRGLHDLPVLPRAVKLEQLLLLDDVAVPADDSGNGPGQKHGCQMAHRVRKVQVHHVKWLFLVQTACRANHGWADGRAEVDAK